MNLSTPLILGVGNISTLDAIASADQAEAYMWELTAQAQNAQRIADLWAFEAENAVNQQKKIRQQMKEEKKVRNKRSRFFHALNFREEEK